jgi:hypothetical protein
LIKYIYEKDKIIIKNWHVYSISQDSTLLDFMYKLFLAFPGIYNNIAFYFLVRSSYRIRLVDTRKRSYIKTEDFNQYKEDNCLNEYTTIAVESTENNLEKFQVKDRLTINDKANDDDKNEKFIVDSNNNDLDKNLCISNRYFNDSQVQLSRFDEFNNKDIDSFTKNNKKSTTKKCGLHVNKDISEFLND